MKERRMKKLFSAILAMSLAGSLAPSVLAEGTATDATTEITTEKKFIEDFEGYEVGTLPSFISIDGGTQTGSGVVDDGTGNKVFMLKYNRSASYRNMYLDLGKTFSDGSFNYDYKFKIVNSDGGDWYDYFMAPYDTVNDKKVIQNKVGSKVQFYNNTNNPYSDIEGLKDENGYYNIHEMFDLVNAKVYPPIKDTYGATSDSLTGALQFNKLRFRTNHASSDGIPAVTGDEANAAFAIIYIDDIEITPIDPIKMVSKNAPIGGEVLKSNLTYTATFDYDLATVSASNIIVEKDGAAITEGFTVAKSGKTLTVTFAEELNEGSKYKITATGVAASNALYGTAADTVIADFTAVEATDSFVQNFDNYEVGDVPYFVSSTGASMAAEVADDGTGNNVLKVTYSETADSYKILVFDLGYTYAEGAYDYDYDFKIVNSAIGCLSPFMVPYTDKDITTRQLISRGMVYAGSHIVSYDRDGIKNDAGYLTSHSVINFDTDKIYVPAISGTGLTEKSFDNADATMSKIRIRGLLSSSGIGKAGEDSEYYSDTVDTYFIDNINIAPVETMKLTGKNTAIGSEVLNTNKAYKVFFNYDLGTVSASNVIVEKDGVAITEGFTVAKSGNALTVTFDSDLTVGSKYKITATGIPASSAMYGTAKDTVIADFTARDKIDEFVEDFEDYEVGDVPYFVSIFGGNKMQAEVTKDETGNKALKITMDSENTTQWYGMRIMLGNDFTMGSYNYDYDVKIVNAQAGRFQPFMQLQNYTSEKSVDIQNRTLTLQKSDDGTEDVPSFVFGNGYWVVAENLPETNGYYNIDAYVDLDNRVQGFPLKDGTGRRVWPLEPTDAVADDPDTEEDEAVAGTNAFNAIYMKAIKYGTALGIAASEGSEYLSETVDTYFVDNISITPRRGLWASDEKIATVKDGAGNKVTAKIDMREQSAENYTVIFALYNNVRLEEVKTVKKADLVNGYAIAELTVPENAENCKLSYMIFDSINGMRPIGGKTNF